MYEKEYGQVNEEDQAREDVFSPSPMQVDTKKDESTKAADEKQSAAIDVSMDDSSMQSQEDSKNANMSKEVAMTRHWPLCSR